MQNLAAYTGDRGEALLTFLLEPRYRQLQRPVVQLYPAPIDVVSSSRSPHLSRDLFPGFWKGHGGSIYSAPIPYRSWPGRSNFSDHFTAALQYLESPSEEMKTTVPGSSFISDSKKTPSSLQFEIFDLKSLGLRATMNPMWASRLNRSDRRGC
jgi:hypothetical protein